MFTRFTVLALLFVLSPLAGCLERKETLTVRPDGSVYCEIAYSSSTTDDIYAGDAVPAPGSGWIVDEQTQESDRGELSYTLQGVLVTEPGGPLPSTYASSPSEQALSFPTELVIEPRGDGTYYHFHRTYEARRWAYVHLKQIEFVDEPLKGIKDKPENELTDADRTQLIHAFARFEVEKAMIFAREALLEVAPDTPQDHWLALAQAMRNLPSEVDYASLIQIFGEQNERTREREVKAQVEKWENALTDRLESSARTMMEFGPGKLNRFLDAFAARKREFAVTEDLGDDVFKIEVRMPGVIVATNAAGSEGATARWEFSGQQLRDARVELMVTSVVSE